MSESDEGKSVSIPPTPLARRQSERIEALNALLQFIETLFPKDHFPKGVPEPSEVTHYYTISQAGAVGHILEEVAKFGDPVTDAASTATFRAAVLEAQTAFNRWQEAGGSTVNLPARPLAVIFHGVKHQLDDARRGYLDPIWDHLAPDQHQPRTKTQNYGDWQVVERLGRGGQGTVYQARHVRSQALGALKVFRFNKENRSKRKQARERFKREVDTLEALRSHPAVLRLLDSDKRAGWMVTELHPGTLDRHLERFRGDPLAALSALRPVIDAIAQCHEHGDVHRDIKLINMFVAQDRRLVLGDFGLTFHGGPDDSRLTRTSERVGSTYWIAPWADRPERLEAVDPTLDIFPLGKLLWCLVAGRPFLHLWYWDRDENNLETIFPDEPGMSVVNEILAHTVVEDSKLCLASGKELLAVVDVAIRRLKLGGTKLRRGKPWPCRICGRGAYQPVFQGRDLCLQSQAPRT